MDLTALKEIQKQALDLARQSGRLEDLESAANIAKQTIEAEATIAERMDHPKVMRYEAYKTLAGLIVPFLSVATLAVTVYIQTEQLRATRESNEDTEWRESVKNVLSQLSRPQSTIPDPALAMALLQPYTLTGRYQRDATLLSVELLSRVPSSDRLKDYFLSHNLGENGADIPFLTDLNREMFNNLDEVEQQLSLPSPPPIPPQVRTSLVDNLEFITSKLCALYRNTSLTSHDLAGVFLMNGSLAGANLVNANMDRAKFQTVDFTGTSMGGNATFSDTHFVDSHWWDAREIAKPLLQYLLANAFPYYDNANVTYEVAPPSKSDYVNTVLRLCAKVSLSCDSASIRYGEAPVAEQKQN